MGVVLAMHFMTDGARHLAPRPRPSPRGVKAGLEQPRQRDERGEEQAGEGQVQRELDGRDRDHAGLEPRRDHDPADKALQRKEQAHAEDDGAEPQAHHPPQRDKQEAAEHQHADEAAELPVAPFPPIDELEFRKAHALVEELILRNLPVFLEFAEPVGVIERRDRACYRTPLGDRQARSGQARGPAHDDHDEDEHDQRHQPGAHQSPVPVMGDQRCARAGCGQAGRRENRVGKAHGGSIRNATVSGMGLTRRATDT